MTPRRRLVVLSVAVAAGCTEAFVLARSPATANQSPAFEVVSIKPNTSGAPQMVIRTLPSGLMTGTNVTVTMLIRYAYGMPDYRIFDAPAWPRQLVST